MVFLIAVKATEAIQERLFSNEGILKGAENWLLNFEYLDQEQTMGVSLGHHSC